MSNDGAPLTLEGWYSLCTAWRVDRGRLRGWSHDDRQRALDSAAACLREVLAPADGWSTLVSLVNSDGDVLLLHLRPTLDALLAVRTRLTREPLWTCLVPTFTFLSVCEVALYPLTVELQRDAAARGGEVGDDAYEARRAERLAAEREVGHTKRRLYPPLPADMPYTCFYPMSKRRHDPHNWYTLALDERDRLMRAHGEAGRRHRGRIAQVVSGATGLDDWEWGVTLFARDPLAIKRVVTDLRYDAASAEYAEFGPFLVGCRTTPETWLDQLP